MIKIIISFLYHFFIGTYKDNTVCELKDSVSDITDLYVYSKKGINIKFHCKKINFLIKNHHPLIPDYQYSLYRLSGECDDNGSEKLKNILKKIEYFPRLGSIFISEEKRRKFLIENYISLLNHELMLNNDQVI